MRVLILAYDGLEATLVERYNLANILQHRHGIYQAAVSPSYRKPHTPSAWTTIITGIPPEQHGVDRWWTYGRLEKLAKLPPFRWIPGKRRILNMLGLGPRLVKHGDWQHPLTTIFDYAAKPIALFVPAYNEPTWPHKKLSKAIHESIGKYIDTIWEIHTWRRRIFTKMLSKDWDLFMVWFDLADLLGHVCWRRCRSELYRAYKELDDIANYAAKHVPTDTLILVLSDHGMKDSPDGVTGDHSEYGFWSINKELDWFRPRKATDFHGLIVRALQA